MAEQNPTEGSAPSTGAPQTGWEGRCFEDFTVGDVYQHPLGRTVTTADNVWFTGITHNPNPIHFDTYYASQTEFKTPRVNSTCTPALGAGLSVADISRNAVKLGWDQVRLPAPVFEGDTIYAQTEILHCRESKSRPNMGLVELKTTGFKQDGTVVMEFRRTILVYKRGHSPARPLPKMAPHR